MRRVVVVVQARFGSRRLPGKAVRPLAGRPMLDHVLERALDIHNAHCVLLATSGNPKNDALCDIARARGIAPYRLNPENDVLRRVTMAAQVAHADVVVRVTGDCPLLDPQLCDAVIAKHLDEDGAYTCNVNVGWPDGTDCEAINMGALEAAERGAYEQQHREHVTMWTRHRLHHITAIEGPLSDLTGHKWSVDTEEDYERVSQIYGHLPPGLFTVSDTLDAEEKI